MGGRHSGARLREQIGKYFKIIFIQAKVPRLSVRHSAPFLFAQAHLKCVCAHVCVLSCTRLHKCRSSHTHPKRGSGNGVPTFLLPSQHARQDTGALAQVRISLSQLQRKRKKELKSHTSQTRRNQTSDQKEYVSFCWVFLQGEPFLLDLATN